MKRLIPLIVVVLVIAACGGETKEGDSEPSGADTTQPTNDQAPDTTAASGSGGSGDAPSSVSGIGEATVTVNGETYHYGETSFPALQCNPDLFGVFFAVLGMVDENGNEVPPGDVVQLTLLHSDADPDTVGEQMNAVSLRVSALGEEWIANPEEYEFADQLEPGSSEVTDVTIDGNTAWGTATFYEENSYFAFVGGAADEYSVSEGTFEVACAG